MAKASPSERRGDGEIASSQGRELLHESQSECRVGEIGRTTLLDHDVLDVNNDQHEEWKKCE